MKIDMNTEATPPQNAAEDDSEDYSTDKNEEEKKHEQNDEDITEVERAQIAPMKQNHKKFTRPIEEEAQDSSQYSSIKDLKKMGAGGDGESPYMGTEETADLKDRVDKSDLDENASY